MPLIAIQGIVNWQFQRAQRYLHVTQSGKRFFCVLVHLAPDNLQIHQALIDLHSPEQERNDSTVSSALVVFEIGARQPQGTESGEEWLVGLGRVPEVGQKV